MELITDATSSLFCCLVGKNTSTFELSELNKPYSEAITPFEVRADSSFILGRLGQKLLSSGGRVIQEIGHRVKWVLHVPVTLLSTAVDGLIGTVSTVGSVVTGGTIPRLNRVADTRLRGADMAASNLFYDALRIINPRAEMPYACVDSGEERLCNPAFYTSSIIGRKLTTPWVEEIRNITSDEKSGWLAKHVVARVDSVVLLGATVIGKVADLVVGIFAGIAAVFTAGTNREINRIAYDGLRLPITDLMIAVRSIINPQSLPEQLPEAW